MVIMKLGEEQKKVKFLVDTGATCWVLNQALMPLGSDYVRVKVQPANLKRHTFVNL